MSRSGTALGLQKRLPKKQLSPNRLAKLMDKKAKKKGKPLNPFNPPPLYSIETRE